VQILKQFRGSFWTREQIADDKHRPLVTNQLEGASYRAAVDLASSHNQTSLSVLCTKYPELLVSDNLLVPGDDQLEGLKVTKNTSNPKGGTSGCCLVS